MIRRVALAALTAGVVVTGLTPAIAMAQDGSGGDRRAKYYRAPSTAAANLPFSDSVRVGRTLYVNSQIGNKPGVAKVVSGGLKAELDQAMLNVRTIVIASGLEMDDVFRCGISLTDMSKWPELNSLWPSYFRAGHLPVRSVVGATALPLGASVAVECVGDAK